MSWRSLKSSSWHFAMETTGDQRMSLPIFNHGSFFFFFSLLSDVFAAMKSHFTIELTQWSFKSHAQEFPGICDHMFHQIQKDCEGLSNVMLIINQERWLSHRGHCRHLGWLGFSDDFCLRLLRWPSLKLLMLINFWAVIGVPHMENSFWQQVIILASIDNKCNWLSFPFLSICIIFLWFLSSDSICRGIQWKSVCNIVASQKGLEH